MKFETVLAVTDSLFASEKEKERATREGFTSEAINCIVGLKTKDGAVLISRESWKRLELFMALFSEVEMSISEEKLKAVLEGKPNK